MRRIISFLLGIMGLFGALQALAQTPTPIPITGNLGAIVGTGQPYAGVSIQLQNCASPVSITGYFGIVQTGYQIRASSSGLITGTVWPNDLITCNGTTGNSEYNVALMNGGTVSGTPQCYQVTSTQGIWNMNTQQPIPCSQSPPNPQDAQYRNLNITGCFSVDGGPCGGSLLPCPTVAAIQIGNASVNGLTCDPNITIDTITHTLRVGVLPTLHVSIGALSTPTAWTLDTSSPATALASLGGGGVNGGLINQLAYYALAGTTLSGTNTIPSLITAVTRSPGDNSAFPATTAYVALPGAINPTSLQVSSGVAMTANQGTGTKIQHSAGSPATDDCAKFDSTGNTVTAGHPCASPSGTDQFISFAGPNISGSGGSNNISSGVQTETFSPAQPDTSYAVVGCTVVNSTGATDLLTVTAITSSSSFTYELQQVQNNGGNTFSTTINCHLHHA